MVADCKPLNKSGSVIYTLSTKNKSWGWERGFFKVSLMAQTRVHSAVTLEPVEVSFAADWISFARNPRLKKASQSLYS